MRRERQPYERGRRLPTLMLLIILLLPWLMVTEIDESPWRATASPFAVAAVLVGVGVGLYTLMFLLIFYRFPRWIRAHRSEEDAKRWRYAALGAGVLTAPITIAAVVQRLLPGDLGAGLAMLAVVGVFTIFSWLAVRHFPEACNWIPFRQRTLKDWTARPPRE